MDFTEYGHPAPEWESFVATHPEAASNPDEPTKNPEPKPPADGLDNAVRVEDVQIPRREDSSTTVEDEHPLTVRIYTRSPPRPDELRLDAVPAVVYYHHLHHSHSDDADDGRLCALLASRLRVVVVHVHSYSRPGRRDDSRDAFEWVYVHADRLGVDRAQIVVVGMGCGAGVAASTALRVCGEDGEEGSPREDERRRVDGGGDEGGGGLESSDDVPAEDKVYDRSAPFAGRTRPRGRIRGLVLCEPRLIGEGGFPYQLFSKREATSRVQCAGEGTSTGPDCACGGLEDVEDVPLARDEELARFPRTAFMVAGMDYFRDDGLILAERLKSLGVPRRVHMFKGMPRGFRKYDELWSSRRFDELLLLLVNWALDRTLSSSDVGFHVEQPEIAEREAKSQESRVQEPPYTTRRSGTNQTL